MNNPRLVFFTSHPEGQRALEYIQSRHANIVHITNGRYDFSNPLPDYDVGISFFYNYRIPESELTPNHIWYNFHPAPLPKYRGRNVAYHAIMNGEKLFGATLHYVDKDFDTGDILEMVKFVVLPSDTAGSIAKTAREACFQLLEFNADKIIYGGKFYPLKQGEGCYYPKGEINEYIDLAPSQEKKIRAVTAAPHFAKVLVGGVEYVILPASCLHHSDAEPPRAPETNAHAPV